MTQSNWSELDTLLAKLQTAWRGVQPCFTVVCESRDIEHWAARELLSARIQNQRWTGSFVIHFDHDQQYSISPFVAFFSGEVWRYAYHFWVSIHQAWAMQRPNWEKQRVKIPRRMGTTCPGTRPGSNCNGIHIPLFRTILLIVWIKWNARWSHV